MQQPTCPLCGRTVKKASHLKRLYGTQVCRKCNHAFANRRQFAYIIDAVAWMPIAAALGFAAGVALELMRANDAVYLTADVVLGYVLFPMVFIFKDGFGGHSLGKWACGVQVRDAESHRPIGFVQSWKRNLCLIIPIVPLVVAFTLLKGDRMGDRFGGTKVVWKRFADHPVFSGRLACLKCQYDLHGNTSGVCPECGTPVPAAAVAGDASRAAPQPAPAAV